jgi:hypothetical protein
MAFHYGSIDIVIKKPMIKSRCANNLKPISHYIIYHKITTNQNFKETQNGSYMYEQEYTIHIINLFKAMLFSFTK